MDMVSKSIPKVRHVRHCTIPTATSGPHKRYIDGNKKEQKLVVNRHF